MCLFHGIYCFSGVMKSSSLKWKCHHFDEILITGCAGSCHFDNFQCSQWLKFHQNDDIFVSVITIHKSFNHYKTKQTHVPISMASIILSELWSHHYCYWYQNCSTNSPADDSPAIDGEHKHMAAPRFTGIHGIQFLRQSPLDWPN